MPDGFSEGSHRIVWLKLLRPSAEVFAHLLQLGIPFAGLVCPRSRQEVGVRVRVGDDESTGLASLRAAFAAQVKIPGLHTRLVARDVSVSPHWGCYSAGACVA